MVSKKPVHALFYSFIGQKSELGLTGIEIKVWARLQILVPTHYQLLLAFLFLGSWLIFPPPLCLHSLYKSLCQYFWLIRFLWLYLVFQDNPSFQVELFSSTNSFFKIFYYFWLNCTFSTTPFLSSLLPFHLIPPCSQFTQAILSA